MNNYIAMKTDQIQLLNITITELEFRISELKNDLHLNTSRLDDVKATLELEQQCLDLLKSQNDNNNETELNEWDFMTYINDHLKLPKNGFKRFLSKMGLITANKEAKMTEFAKINNYGKEEVVYRRNRKITHKLWNVEKVMELYKLHNK